MRLVINKLGEGAKRIKSLHVASRKLKDTRLEAKRQSEPSQKAVLHSKEGNRKEHEL